MVCTPGAKLRSALFCESKDPGEGFYVVEFTVKLVVEFCLEWSPEFWVNCDVFFGAGDRALEKHKVAGSSDFAMK